GRHLVQPRSQKTAQRQRVRRPPCDATLAVDAFKIPDEQQTEVPPRRQTRPPHSLRVEPGALLFHPFVKAALLQQLVQPLVERMCHRPRPLRVGNPKLFLRLPLLRSSSHRHARSLRTSALDYARNFTSESRLSPRTARADLPRRSFRTCARTPAVGHASFRTLSSHFRNISASSIENPIQ